MNLPSRLHNFFFLKEIKRFGKFLIITAAFVAAGVIIAGRTVSQAQSDIVITRVPNPPLQADLDVLPGDLRAVAVPTPSNLNDFVRDPVMARPWVRRSFGICKSEAMMCRPARVAT